MFPNERIGALWVTGLFGVLVILPLWLCFAGTREQKEVQQQTGLPLRRALRLTLSNKSFLLLAVAYGLLLFGLWGGFGLGYYVTISYVYGGQDNQAASQLIALGGTLLAPAAIVGSIFWGWLGTKIGKKEGFIASLIAIAVCAPLSWFLYNPTYPYLQLINSSLLGFCFGALGVFPNAMTADICDVDELDSGYRREGAYFGVITLASKLGFSGTFVLTGSLLRLTGFDQTVGVQGPQTVLGLRLCLAFIPIIVMLAIAALIWFYPLSEQRVRQIRAVLEERRSL
jgi:GPH family glycoside/pentoside/hexuronide:cation symporter